MYSSISAAKLKSIQLQCQSQFNGLVNFIYFFIYLGFYVTFNTVQVISRRVVGRAEEPVHTVGQGSVL